MPLIVRRHLAVLTHVPFEGPGAIEDWAAARGHGLSRIALHRGETLPRVGDVDALVVMGGPMGADDEARFSFLADEKALLRACIEARRPVLGVCLGAQLLARTLDARVTAQGYREIGWFPLRWSAAARRVPGFSHVPAESTVFHWHGDTFAVPAGTVPLASSGACASQGFATPDGRVVGLQFHVEMRDEDVRALVDSGRHELADGGRFVQAEHEILSGFARHGAALRPLLESLLDGWITTAAPSGPIFRFFADDHRRLDAFLRQATARDGPIDLEAFASFRAGILRHIGMEEKALFTVARNARGGQPLDLAARLRVDHGAIAALLVPTPTREIVAKLRSVLEPHNRREEEPGGAYDAADAALGLEAAEHLVEELRSFPEPPLKPYNDAPAVFRHIEENLALSRRQW
jgi:GMP synthase-like glutamine amidotransferase